MANTYITFECQVFDTKGDVAKTMTLLAHDWNEANQLMRYWFARGQRWMIYSGYKLARKT